MNEGPITIMGGGFAGMTAALGLAQANRPVTIIEAYPFDGKKAAGQPQSDHVHIFTAKGQKLLEDLCTGILSELKNQGAVEVDWGLNTSWDGGESPLPFYISGVRNLLLSRKLLTKVLWHRISNHPHIKVLKARVLDFEWQHQHIKSLKIWPHYEMTEAHYYIDARGRASRLKVELEKVLGSIKVQTIPNQLRYITALIDHAWTDHTAILQYYRKADPFSSELGYYAAAIENGNMLFTAVDYTGKHPDPLAILRRHPVLGTKKNLGMSSFIGLQSWRPLYKKCPYWPKNLLVMGDALGRLSPIHGQGLTIALEQVILLKTTFNQSKPLNTQKALKSLSAPFDRRWQAVWLEEKKGLGLLEKSLLFILRAFTKSFAKATQRDLGLHKLSLLLIHGQAAPIRLLAPKTIIKIISALFTPPGIKVPKKSEYAFSKNI